MTTLDIVAGVNRNTTHNAEKRVSIARSLSEIAWERSEDLENAARLSVRAAQVAADNPTEKSLKKSLYMSAIVVKSASDTVKRLERSLDAARNARKAAIEAYRAIRDSVAE